MIPGHSCRRTEFCKKDEFTSDVRQNRLSTVRHLDEAATGAKSLGTHEQAPPYTRLAATGLGRRFSTGEQHRLK